MTNELKAKLLLQMLRLAPMKKADSVFAKMAAEADVEGMWEYFQGCLRTHRAKDDSIDAGGLVSFRELTPAIEAVYRIPQSDSDLPF